LSLPEEFSRKLSAKIAGSEEGQTVPVVLLGIGVFAVVAGLLMVGFGIPINEFSFGNTLIGAGTTATVGGLIIIGLGMAVRQLRRIAEALDHQAHARPAQPVESIETAGRLPPAQGRVAFPPRPKPETHPSELVTAPLPPPPAVEERPFQSAAPQLRNPDEPLDVEDEVPLTPPLSSGAPGADADLGRAPWPAPPPRAPEAPNFDAMWPSEPKPAKSAEPKAEPKLDPRSDTFPREMFGNAPKPEFKPEPTKPRAVAILKSGVVDGMGYTLYVDGSIEAELPQGTLRFASINELRSHLEKNS